MISKDFLFFKPLHIVNFEKIEKVSGNLVYTSDEKIPIGKTYKEEFLNKMKYIK